MPHIDSPQIGRVACESNDSRDASVPTMEIWTGQKKTGKIAKWFKPATRARAADAYWDPAEECIKNTSDKMLTKAMANVDDLYWAAEKPAPDPASPKRK